MAACPACGKELPGEFPFCPFCAAPLHAGAPPSSLEERKIVSVLFCDLVGFTAASEAVDPEDVRARLRPYHARLRDEVERFGGTVEKFVGDAVMAVFGAPVAHEDDAERAVRAGLRILEAIGELNEADPGLGLQVRVGINTGEAVVALGARPELGEGIVAGDVVNTASRLQGAAPVDGVAVSEQTHRRTERVFEYEPLEPVVLKGKAQPVPLFRPLHARAELGRDVVRTHTTPLIGRDLEKSLLIGTFERAGQQRSCQLVTLVGEPGVGKSRMCAELLRRVDAQRDLVRWRQGRCLPYGEGIAFWALGEIVKAECGILESNTPSEAAARLEQRIPAGEPERAWLLARLAPLVGVPAEPTGQEETFAAWRRFCEALAAERTTVLVFEDLHWADSALLAFLEHLADWAEGVPLLLLCTARPELYERDPGFGANARNAQRINLEPLSNVETARLVSALLEQTVLPAETQRALLEQAGGNPLYAEEFVRLLADRGRIGDGVEVPDSVHALIAARLDTLPPERKSLLQDASVLGKVFWSGALATMGGRDRREVELALHELARKEFVRSARTSSMEDEHEYAFWHVLVRDVCYGQIPRAARAARHQAAAVWLEETAGERVEDLADVLAHHYVTALELNRAAGAGEQAEELEGRAVRYLGLAGTRALPLDVAQAERHLARALELAPAGHPERASVLEHWAQAAQQQGRLQDAREALEEALDLHRADGDSLAVGRVLTHLALVLHRLGDASSREVIDEAVRVLESRPAGPELVAAHAYTAGRYVLTDDAESGIASAERALALAAELGLPEPAFSLMWRGLGRSLLGAADGVEDMRRALRLALEQNLGRETAVIYGNLAAGIWFFDGPELALGVLEEAIDYCERRGIIELAAQMRGTSLANLAELGRIEAALAGAGPTADRVEATGDKSFTAFRGLQLRLLAERGSIEDAPDPDELVAAARAIGEPVRIGMAICDAGPLVLALGRRQRVQALLRELDELSAEHDEPVVDVGQLTSLLRVAAAVGETPLAERLVVRTSRTALIVPRDKHAAFAAQAPLAEAARRYADAAQLYGEAADRWQQFGNVPERAYALLGRGRCLLALGDAAAEVPLGAARDLFASMGYTPALAETAKLLAETVAKTA